MTHRSLLFIISLSVFGCGRYQYASSPHYVPLNTKKGELKAHISTSTFHAGYAFTNNFSAFATAYVRGRASGMNLLNGATKENSGQHTREEYSHEITLGGSYFKSTDNFTMELLAGGGFGKISYEHTRDWLTRYEFEFEGDKRNIFLQPEVGFRFDDVELGIFSRFNMVKYYNISSMRVEGSGPEPETEDNFLSGKNSANMLFVEPGVACRIGSKNVRFQTILYYTQNLTTNDMRYRQLNIHLGCAVNVDVLKKNK